MGSEAQNLGFGASLQSEAQNLGFGAFLESGIPNLGFVALGTSFGFVSRNTEGLILSEYFLDSEKFH